MKESSNLREKLELLIPKYSRQIPRYTSYPTAIEFNDSLNSSKWVEAIKADSGSDKSYSLYVHIPFCHKLCYFCACNKIIPKDREIVLPYLRSVVEELKHYQQLLGSEVYIEQIHWGGGTPNFLTPKEMCYLHSSCVKFFPNIATDADISIEVDPRTMTIEHLEVLRELGFNRISLGVQDFNLDVQRLINRVQSFETTAEVCLNAREVGFSEVNIDLIYGLPNQTREGFADTLKRVRDIAPDRIALYGYAHVTWVKKVQKALERAHLPTSKERVDLFLDALDFLTSVGYEHIGLDHFALPADSLAKSSRDGTLNRNFMGYTTHKGARIIGVGVSAISSLPEGYAQNSKDLREYQQNISEGGMSIERGLAKNRDDLIRGEIIEALLCQGEILISSFESRWNIKFTSYFKEDLSRLQPFNDDGLIQFIEDKILITKLGRFFQRNIASAFDTYLHAHTERENVFSQAV